MKKIIKAESAPAPIGPYNHAIMHDNTLYISGQICMDAATGELKNEDVKEETHQVMKNLAAILKEAKMNFSHVIKSSIFITDMNKFSEINEVYNQYFNIDYPARETIEVAALPKFVNVEISMIAAI